MPAFQNTDFRENPGATRQPGFLISPSRSSPHCGRSAELSTKAGSLQGYGLLLWYSPQDTALIRALPTAEWGSQSALMVARAASACDGLGAGQGFLEEKKPGLDV